MTYFTKFNVSFNCELDCTIEEAQALSQHGGNSVS